MAATSFDRVPISLFRARMTVPLAAVFAFGFLVMGGVAVLPEVQAPHRSQSPIAPPSVLVTGNPVQAARLQWEQTWGYWWALPAVCVGDNAVNDFQREQCENFWERVLTGTGVSAIPFFAVLLFWLMVSGEVSVVYRRAQKKIAAGQAEFVGSVADGTRGPDLFCWYYCLQSVSVQPKQGPAVTVYLPLSHPALKVGQELVVFSLGKMSGRKRWVGQIYLPHVAVIG